MCVDYRNPVAIITKGPLIERDVDVLVELHRVTQLSVTMSIPIWDSERARAIEPNVATPERRMRTVERLARAGLTVGVNVAPMIPGLSDEDMAKILEAARAAGAQFAGSVFLRLPGSVRAVFEERLRQNLPLRADRILSRVREARGGKLNSAEFGKRFAGEGPYAAAARALFLSTCERLGLRTGFPEPDAAAAPTFRRPLPPPQAGDQLRLF